jgi:hypothetical protein
MKRVCQKVAVVALPLCVMSLGCSRTDQVPVYPVRGQVLLNGKPLANATLVFHAQVSLPKDVRPSAKTDSEGKFTVTSFETGDGAPEGSYQVSLTCYNATTKGNAVEGDYSVRNVLPARYASPATSRIRADVKKGDNELPPIQLSNH